MKTYSLFFIFSLLYCGILCASDHTIYIAKYKGDRVCAISYTFDDGLSEQYTLAAPQLEKRGFRGTFTINGGKINRDASHITDTTRMTWPQVKELSDRGHEISNHGWMHKNFSRFPLEELREDIRKNDSAIFSVTGIMPRTFCYPNNNKKAEGRRIAEQNRVGTRLKQRSVGSKTTPESLEQWVEQLIAAGEWGVGMTHGITYGYDAFGNPQRFWDHLDKVKAREDKIWVGTFCEVVSYIKERENIRLRIEEGRKKILVTPEMSLDKELFVEPLTLVVENLKIRAARQGGKELSVMVRNGKALIDFAPAGGTVELKLK